MLVNANLEVGASSSSVSNPTSEEKQETFNKIQHALGVDFADFENIEWTKKHLEFLASEEVGEVLKEVRLSLDALQAFSEIPEHLVSGQESGQEELISAEDDFEYDSDGSDVDLSRAPRIIFAMAYKDIELVEKMLKSQIFPNLRDVETGMYPEHYAVRFNIGTSYIERLLKCEHVDFNRLDWAGQTLLGYAVQAGNDEIANLLKEQGATLSEEDSNALAAKGEMEGLKHKIESQCPEAKKFKPTVEGYEGKGKRVEREDLA